MIKLIPCNRPSQTFDIIGQSNQIVLAETNATGDTIVIDCCGSKDDSSKWKFYKIAKS